MKKIIEILMRRDNISQKEAKERISICKERLDEEAFPTGDYELATEILEEELGLEMDYIFNFL